MFEYNVQFLRTEDPFDSKEAAIAFLDNYKGHMIGQPICVYYRDSNAQSEILSLLAIGRKNGEQQWSGPSYYDIVNSTNVLEVRPESLHWHKLSL